MKKKSNPFEILLAILLAALFGSFVGKEVTLFGISFYSVFDILGTLFLNALTLIVVPLVSSSIITGVSKIGGEDYFKRMGAKMFLFYIGTSLIAVLIGLFFVNIIGPGYSSTALVGSSLDADQLSALQRKAASHDSSTFISVLISVIPTNILQALSHGEMLGLIFFSLIFGYCITKIESTPASVLRGFFQGVFQTMIEFTHVIMRFLPYGVFCLIAKVFMTSGLDSLKSALLLFVTVLLGLGFFMFVALPLLLKVVGKVEPVRHFKAMMPALVTAFSTSSSSATLPVTIDCTEKRAGVSNKICSLVLPLGNSINMSGSALYECVAAMFIAQAYGLEMSFATQFAIVVLSLITSIGVAGIPSGSIVAILIILKVMGLPSEGIGLFVAIDRLLDMCRTTANVFSDSCCAILVARLEGEKDILTNKEFA